MTAPQIDGAVLLCPNISPSLQLNSACVNHIRSCAHRTRLDALQQHDRWLSSDSSTAIFTSQCKNGCSDSCTLDKVINLRLLPRVRSYSTEGPIPLCDSPFIRMSLENRADDKPDRTILEPKSSALCPYLEASEVIVVSYMESDLGHEQGCAKAGRAPNTHAILSLTPGNSGHLRITVHTSALYQSTEGHANIMSRWQKSLARSLTVANLRQFWWHWWLA